MYLPTTLKKKKIKSWWGVVEENNMKFKKRKEKKYLTLSLSCPHPKEIITLAALFLEIR